MLERIWTQTNQISEVVRTSTFAAADHYEHGDVAQALEKLKQYEWLTFPEYEDEELVVISLADDHVIFIFGNSGAFQRYPLRQELPK